MFAAPLTHVGLAFGVLLLLFLGIMVAFLLTLRTPVLPSEALPPSVVRSARIARVVAAVLGAVALALVVTAPLIRQAGSQGSRFDVLPFTLLVAGYGCYVAAERLSRSGRIF